MAESGGKKGRKIGRNVKKCDYYRNYRAVPNKLRKLKRHLNRHPLDACAQTAIQLARVMVRG